MNKEMQKVSPLSSSRSIMVSLESIRLGKAGLDQHRRSIFQRVPNSGDWARFQVECIAIKDIAFLAAYTGHEFALLRSKKADILFHGIKQHCIFDDEIMELLKSKKFRLVAHTHPDYGTVQSSQDDRLFLEAIEQEESIIISSITGKQITFGSNMFDNMLGR